jgi:hypothetical protein
MVAKAVEMVGGTIMSNPQTTIFHPQLWGRLRTVQALAFCDKCRLLVFSEAYDAIGNTAENYTAGSEIPCRYYTGAAVAAQGYEILAQSEIPRNSTWLALPLGTVVQPMDRIRITERQGADIDPVEDYEVAGFIVTGTTALIVRLRPVDDYINPDV